MTRWKGRLVVLIASWRMCVMMLHTEMLLEFASRCHALCLCVVSLCCAGFKALNSSIISWLVLTRPHPGWLLRYEVRLEVALELSSVFKKCHLRVGGRASSRQRLWWGTERSGVSFTTLHCHGGWEGRP